MNATTVDPGARRFRGRVMGVLAIANAPAGPVLGAMLDADAVLSALFVAMAVVQVVGGVLLWRSGHRVGDLGFLAVQMANLALLVPVLVITTPVHSLRSSELVLLGPTVLGAVYAGRRWQAVVSTLACIAGANAVTLHRLAGLDDVGAELLGEFFTFAAIAFVVRALRESALRALAESRRREVIDPLTGLPNRKGFEEGGFGTWLSSSSRRLPLALLAIDVDHFKAVNDTHGHAAGDDLLRRLGALLQRDLREGDIAVRLGGEEFAVLAAVRPGEGAVVAERLRAAIEAELAPVTVSIGVHEWQPGGQPADAVADELWRATAVADDALYAAKRGGRNRVVVAPSDG